MTSNSGLAERGLRPAAELFADKPHGTRNRYLAGCKCFYCRRANSDYERERKAAREAGDWNGIVGATKARAHLRKLSRSGIGRRRIRELCGVGDTVLHQIKTGKKKRIRARTERLILGVTPIEANKTGSTLIDATATWKRIEELLEEGFTKTRIARELGYKSPGLQLHKDRVTVNNHRKVLALWRRYMTEGGG